MGYSVTWETGACFSRERRNPERGSSQGNVLSLSYLMAENDEVMQGQGYDGAKSMSCDRVGCQAIIRQQASLAAYTHSSGHCLNLVVANVRMQYCTYS